MLITQVRTPAASVRLAVGEAPPQSTTEVVSHFEFDFTDLVALAHTASKDTVLRFHGLGFAVQPLVALINRKFYEK